MNGQIFYSAGHTAALDHTVTALRHKGCTVADSPSREVTHLLLDAPAFTPDGKLKSGADLSQILSALPQDVTVCGGNLQHPGLADYKTLDLLQDPLYLAENARITAHCAVKLAINQLPVTLWGCHALVIGWGRIGKCLAQLLKAMGAIVTVAARQESQRAMLLALGYDVLDANDLTYSLQRFRIIFNTAPVLLIPREAMEYCCADCIKMDLASLPGMEADDVIWARGLPGKEAPESSGELIARTVLRLIAGKEN